MLAAFAMQINGFYLKIFQCYMCLLCIFYKTETMRTEKGYLEPISCLQWACFLSSINWENDMGTWNCKGKWRASLVKPEEEQWQMRGLGRHGEKKGKSSGERLQEEINRTVAGPWGTCGSWEGWWAAQQWNHTRHALELSWYLTRNFYLRMPLVSMCWLIFMATYGFHSWWLLDKIVTHSCILSI